MAEVYPLLVKFLSGEADSRTHSAVMAWVSESRDNELEFLRAAGIWKATGSSALQVNSQQALARITARIEAEGQS